MAKEKGNHPHTDLGKRLAKLIAKTEKLVKEGEAVYQELKELKEMYPPKKKG